MRIMRNLRRKSNNSHSMSSSDTKQVRAAGRATMGVKLLNLDTDDKVASATVISPEDPKATTEGGTLLQ